MIGYLIGCDGDELRLGEGEAPLGWPPAPYPHDADPRLVLAHGC